MDDVTGAQLAARLGTASDELEMAVDDYRKASNITSTDRRRLNEAMDDLICSVERVKIAHTRLLERAGNQPGGM